MKKTRTARVDLAANLKYLMAKNGHVEKDVEKLSGVSQKTINNIRNAATSPRLENVEDIASIYGLSAWEILVPGLPEEDEVAGRIGLIYRHYKAATREGRAHITMVAEREAAYTTK